MKKNKISCYLEDEIIVFCKEKNVVVSSTMRTLLLNFLKDVYGFKVAGIVEGKPTEKEKVEVAVVSQEEAVQENSIQEVKSL